MDNTYFNDVCLFQVKKYIHVHTSVTMRWWPKCGEFEELLTQNVPVKSVLYFGCPDLDFLRRWHRQIRSR